MGTFRFAWYGVLALGLAACNDPLVVTNLNQPDRGRVFSNATDLEQFVSALYANVHAGTLGQGTVLGGGSNDGLQPQLAVMGMENVSALANFAMGPRGAVPRNPITNARGSQGNVGNYRDWVVEHRAARMAALAIATLKTVTLGSAARDARARAFSRFVQGVALGNLALAYDSASILTENDNPQADAEVVVPLSSYRVVMAAALQYLDSAIAIANATPSGSDGFPLPSTWFNGITTMDVPSFVRLCRSYKARFRATVARTPADLATVDWTAVLGDATNGITADFQITMNPPPAGGWDIAWVIQAFATGSANWHQMSQFWLGMADTSGAYTPWLASTMPTCGRCAFLVVTPDKRFPTGATRAAQQAASPTPTAPIAFTATPYFRNRPTGEDQPGDAIGISQYDFFRSRAFRNANRTGPYPVMTAAEIRLYAAEAQLELNNIAAAAGLIDSSRTGNGKLSSLVAAAITDTVMRVPGVNGVQGSNSCVPRIPDPAANFKATKCGNIWDALKWEYRMETAYAGYGMWFFAGRGWSDLPEGTALDWPVPYQEMDSRAETFYGTGGVAGRDAASRGNYGLFGGGVY